MDQLHRPFVFVSLAAFGALVSDAATFHVFTSAISFPIS